MPKQWEHGLMCGYCCNDTCSTCCFAYVCPCGVYYRNLELMNDKGLRSKWGNSPLLSACLYVWAGGAFFMECGTRADIRQQLDIEGNCCTDCLAVCFCHSCALTQEYHQLEKYEGRGDTAAPLIVREVVTTNGMQQ